MYVCGCMSMHACVCILSICVIVYACIDLCLHMFVCMCLYVNDISWQVIIRRRNNHAIESKVQCACMRLPEHRSVCVSPCVSVQVCVCPAQISYTCMSDVARAL